MDHEIANVMQLLLTDNTLLDINRVSSSLWADAHVPTETYVLICGGQPGKEFGVFVCQARNISFSP